MFVSGIAAVASYGTNVMLGRMSHTMLGTYTLLSTISMFLATFLVFGGSNVVVHFTSGATEERRRGFLTAYALLVAGILGAGSLVVLAFPGALAAVFGRGIAGVSMSAVMVIVASSAITTMAIAYSQARLAMVRAAVGQGVTAVFVAVVVASATLIGMLNDGSLQTILALGWALAAIAAVIVAAFVPRAPDLPALGGSFWAYAMPFHISTIAFFVTSNIDVLAASRVVSVDALGTYKVAMLGRQLVQWVPAMVLAPAYPLLRHCEVQGLPGQFAQLLNRYVRVATAIAFFSMAILVALSGPFLALFGRGYVRASTPLLILATASAVLFPVGVVAGAAVVAKGRIWASLLVNVITSAIGFPLTLFLASRWQLPGLAGGSALVLLLSTLLSGMIARKAGVMLPLRDVAVSAAGAAVIIGMRTFWGTSWVVSLMIAVVAVGLPLASGMISLRDLRVVVQRTRSL